jgi:hypothetical protein
VSIRIEREPFAPICYLADPAVREAGPVSQAEGQPIDSWAVAETNLYDGVLSDEPSVDPQDVSEARQLLSQQLEREVNAAAAIVRGDLPAIEDAIAELEEVEAHAREVLAATDSTKAERALAARTLAGIIPDEKAGTISLDEQRAALEARKIELSSQTLNANSVTAAEAEKRAASDLLAIDVLQREFGLSPNGPPLEALAKAAGLKKVEEASIKGWARIAAGEGHHPDVERAPLVNALSRLLIERESFNGVDAEALQTLVAEGVKTRADLLARSSDPKVSLELREAARKVVEHPELARAVMPHGTLDRRAIAALDQRRERLSHVGSDGRVLLDRFEARAADNARALSKAIAAGDTGAALSIIADRDQLGRAWLLEEYAAISGEGTLSRELEKLDARAAGSVAGALSLDVSERTALLNGIVEDPPAGTTRATFQTHVLESRLVGLDAHRAAVAKRGNLAQRVAGVQANDAELAYLDATIARARNAVAANDPRAIERVATAELAAEALADGRLQRTDRAIAVVQASVETLRALAISAGAAAVTLKTLGTAAPMVGGVVCSSWLKVAAAVSAGTGAGTIAGSAIAVSDEGVRAFALGRGWNWSNVGRDAQAAVMMSLSTAVSAGAAAGVIGRAAVSANPAVRAMMNNGLIRTMLVAGARSGASMAGDGLSQLAQGGIDARVLAENGAKTFASAALLGQLGTGRSGAADRAWDAALGAAEEVMWNAVTGRDLSANLAQAVVGSALSGALHDQASQDVKTVRVGELRAEAEARAAQRAHGGVHGREVYSQKNVDPGDASRGRLGPSRLSQRIEVIAKSPRMHEARLSVEASGYSLSLTAQDGRALKMSVHVSAEAHETLERQPRHVNADGAEEAGPARATVKRVNGEVQVSIFIGNKVDQMNVDNIIGHELDELADILYRRPGASEGEIKAEMEASVFRRDAVAGAKPTGHDRAQAAEYLTVVGQLAEYKREIARIDAKVAPTSRDREQLVIAQRGKAEREQNITELERVMGLDLPEHASEKLSLLRAASLEGGAVSRASENQREAWKAHLVGRARKYAESTYPEAFRGSLSAGRVAHVIMPEPHTSLGGAGEFVKTGIKGGHHDGEFRRFVNDHPKLGYRLEQDGPDKIVNGVTYRKYKQYLQTSRGEILCTKPKTTTTDAAKLISDGEAVFAKWYDEHSPIARDGERFTWDGATDEGVHLAGFATMVGGRPAIQSIFVEESWIR